MDVAIVGAGAAGAAAAHALSGRADVTVFEATDAVGGRMATRERDGCRYDHGANYIKPDDPEVSALVTETLDATGLIDVGEPIRVFDADGEISEGRAADEHKWTYEGGIATFAERLLGAAAATVELGTPVGALDRADDGWRLADADGMALGRFDAVLLTPPAPETADLVAGADWEAPVRDSLVEALDAVEYWSVDSLLLHYPFRLERPWYALLNADRDYDIWWLSREEAKPAHVPDGESLLVAQTSTGWADRRFEDPDGAVAADAATLVADLLEDERLADPDWTDRTRWHASQPVGAFDAPDARGAAEAEGLYLAGDWLAGEGRVHLAARSGLDVAERIA